MAETKSTTSEKSGCCGDGNFDCGEMMKMMQNFCKGEDGSFNCSQMMKMMQQMSSGKSEKAEE